MSNRAKVLCVLWWTLLIGILVLFALYIIRHPGTQSQWDIQTYYYGGLSHNLGLNPYLPETFKQLSPNRDVFPFLYPPYTLNFFARVSSLGVSSLLFWIPILKVIASSFLIYIWVHFFLGNKYNWFNLFIILFGISCTLYVDFISGNITIFLELLFWGGLAALLEKKYFWGVFLIAISALLKLTPFIILLPLYFFFRQTKKPIIWATVIFCIIVTFSFFYGPEIFLSFIKRSLEAVSYPAPNFSTWALWRDFSRLITGPTQTIFLYGGILLTLISSTYYAWKLLRDQQEITTRNIMICLAWYLIVTPRMHYYYFIALIPLILYLLSKKTAPLLGIAFIALILPSTVSLLQPPYFSSLILVLKTYSQTILLLVTCFGLLCQSSIPKE